MRHRATWVVAGIILALLLFAGGYEVGGHGALAVAPGVSPDGWATLRGCGLSRSEVAALGEQAWLILSLRDSGWTGASEAKTFAKTLLTSAPGPAEMPAFPVDLQANAAELPSSLLPLPNDHPAALVSPRRSGPIWEDWVWQTDGTLLVLPNDHYWIGGPQTLQTSLGELPTRGAFYQVVTPPGQWRISALVELPTLSGLPGVDEKGAPVPLGVYVGLGAEAPGARVDAGLVWNEVAGEWEAYIWDNCATDGDGWRQAPLGISTTYPNAKVFLVFEMAEDGAACDLRVYDPRTWSLMGWFRDTLPAEYHLGRGNYAVQLRYLSAVATANGPVPSGIRYENCGWQAVCVCGWRVAPRGSTPVPGWRLLDMNNTYASGKRPETSSAVAAYPEEPYYGVHVCIYGGE